MSKVGLFDSNNKLKATISFDIDDNIRVIRTIFSDCNDVVKKPFLVDRGGCIYKLYLIYIDGLANNEMVEETIIKPLTYEWKNEEETDLFASILYREMQTVDVKAETDFDLAVGSILKGDTVLFVDGYNQVMVISTKRFPLRGIGENDSEATLRGPKDSFNEGFRQSTALIRRRIRDSKLKVVQGTLGQRSRTDYALVYMSDLVMGGLVEEIKERLNRYEIDAIYDSGMAEHLLEDKWYSPFPVFQTTTRPDKVAAAITEGRLAIVFDNSPEVIIAPTSFNMLMQAADDYYNRWAVSTFARIIRYMAVFIAVTLPGFYVALTAYQSQVLPTRLLYAIASARTLVTFPVVVEVLIMEFLFELLREAGIRLPGPLGNTIGVVGGLIVGQSAVEAGIVSTIVVIIVALTAIASFAIPNEVFASVFRLLKFFVLTFSALFGLYGFMLSLVLLAIHLSGLESFGVPYLSPTVDKGEKNRFESLDFVLRAPIKQMINRPMWVKISNRRRLKRHE